MEENVDHLNVMIEKHNKGAGTGKMVGKSSTAIPKSTVKPNE